jgi:alanine racemase
MTRTATAVIDLQALAHNLQQAQTAAPHSQTFAVIKADGYGHGMVPVARALSDAQGFAVANVPEALALREAGIGKSILLLEGFAHGDELAAIRQQDLIPVIHHAHQLQALEQAGEGNLSVWLKVDTGMHRLGFAPQDAQAVYERLQQCHAVKSIDCLMTHLANADDLADETTQRQLETFGQVLPDTGLPRSIANSAGLLAWPDSRGDVVRPGIMLYGASPCLDETAAQRGLKPVMTLQTQLIATKQCRKGDAVGYGGTWICPEDMMLGVAAIGYGDGYPRHAPSGTPVLVNGERVPLAGRVSMDMICVDLSSQPHAKVGDPVVVWGEDLPVEEIAMAAGTISYELFCGVTGRVPREYVNG